MTTISARSHVDLRAILRLVLLAGAESCWLYALVLLVGAIAGLPRVVSALGIFIVYLTGLAVGRLLPRSEQNWRILQALTILFAIVAIVAALRFGLYTDAPLWDFAWVPTLFSNVGTFLDHVSPEQISIILLILTFVRALGFAQRPLTLWVMGFQFRLGIVIFFAIAFLSVLTVRVNFILYVFLYFGFSLLGIALARIEEAGKEQALGLRWAVVMCGVLGSTMLLGYLITQFLTLDRVNSFFAFFAPVRDVLLVIVTIIAIPFFYLIEFLIQLISPLFQRVILLLAGLFPNIRFDNSATQQVVTEVASRLENVWPYARLVIIVLLVLMVAWWIARALNKRMKWYEQEHFEREALETKTDVQLEKRKRTRGGRATPHSVTAENVRRIYAALLAHAQALGMPRQEAETPLEFLPRLSARFPECASAFQTLTTAYVAVHYAEQQFTPARVRELREVWQQTKTEMTNGQRRTTKP